MNISKGVLVDTAFGGPPGATGFAPTPGNSGVIRQHRANPKTSRNVRVRPLKERERPSYSSSNFSTILKTMVM
eukprot:1190763-Prorocentrum_minimum.AAC.2